MPCGDQLLSPVLSWGGSSAGTVYYSVMLLGGRYRGHLASLSEFAFEKCRVTVFRVISDHFLCSFSVVRTVLLGVRSYGENAWILVGELSH